jgi:GBP family porin
MKMKLAAAAAALLCAGTASAQSTVTLYGIVDLNISHFSGGSQSGVGGLTAMMDGTANGLNGSRWGIRTVEDLGGGLRAGVVAEAGVNADTGASAQGGLGFGRQIYVMLGSSTAGELRLGRQYAVHDVVMGYNNPFVNALVLNPGIGVTNVGRPLPQFMDAPRINNVVQYSTPKFGGLTGTLQYAFGENVADRYTSVMLQYAVDKFNAAASYEWNRDRTTGDRTNKVATAGANYDFGALKVLAGYQRGSDLTTSPGNVGALSNLVVTGPTTFTANDLQVYTAAVSVPVGAFLLGANYTRTRYEGAGGEELSLGKVGLGARYGLSTRTFLYAGVSRATGDLKDFISQKQVIQAGIRHAF